jgi:hypothetical protein
MESLNVAAWLFFEFCSSTFTRCCNLGPIMILPFASVVLWAVVRFFFFDFLRFFLWSPVLWCTVLPCRVRKTLVVEEVVRLPLLIKLPLLDVVDFVLCREGRGSATITLFHISGRGTLSSNVLMFSGDVNLPLKIDPQ